MSRNLFDMDQKSSALADMFASQFTGSAFSETYHLKHLLGTGSFASCWRCRHRQNNQEYAVKIIERTVNCDEEETLLRFCQDHPNIVKLIEVYQTDVYTFLVMELLSGGELLRKSRYSEQETQRVMRQLASAVKFMHSYGIVHRDLKPENIVYVHDGDDSPVKIVDFGFAQLIHSARKPMDTSCFTPPYAAPEVIAHKFYDKSCDMWSLGTILYYMLSGTQPFGHNTIDILRRIKMGLDFNDDVWRKVSPMAKEVILNLLEVNPRKRFTANDLANHPWLAGDMLRPNLNITQPDHAVASTSTTTSAHANEGLQLRTTSKLAQRRKCKHVTSDITSCEACSMNPFSKTNLANIMINNAAISIAPIPASNISSGSNKKRQKPIPEIIEQTVKQSDKTECNVSYKQKRGRKRKKRTSQNTNSNYNFSGPMTRLRKRKFEEIMGNSYTIAEFYNSEIVFQSEVEIPKKISKIAK